MFLSEAATPSCMWSRAVRSQNGSANRAALGLSDPGDLCETGKIGVEFVSHGDRLVQAV